jgi:hypothetical protein
MRATSVLVHSVRNAVSLQIHDALRAGGAEVVGIESPLLACEVIDARAVDLVVVDADAGVPPIILQAAHDSRIPVAAISARPEVAADLLGRYETPHIVAAIDDAGWEFDLDARDLAATAAKATTGDVFGLRSYLDASPIRYVVSDGLVDATRTISADLLAGGLPLIDARRLARLADRLARAVLDGAAHGWLDRSLPIELEVGSDGESLGSSIRFGSSRHRQVRHLLETFLRDDRRAPAFEGCRTIVLNATPGRETEVIGLLPRAPEPGRRNSVHVSIAPGTSAFHAASVRDSFELPDSWKHARPL